MDVVTFIYKLKLEFTRRFSFVNLFVFVSESVGGSVFICGFLRLS
jgi:hypothetical protein